MMVMYRWMPALKTWREAVFPGHFGSMGIGAIFLLTYSNHYLAEYTYCSHPPTTPANYQQYQLQLLNEMIQPIVAFMVLCSIMIYRLSVPGFSRGRRVHSVTRTWFRRVTTGSRTGAPDWTNPARLVTKGEVIVINRDLESEGEGKRGAPLKEQ
jgi:sodium/hydrogen antiporter